ncbi:UDP-N-acetylmuramoyl-tripeptide--D-alanyl-D-alanine ligase [Mangrovitalea sediminis]|uniref:UDP-N-acetylmuramoyl-tripeptide--D-alanyl-D- alanine ligase n=1 Tax=Mangrovitalea sediminis TaxID=1982043 RepID=UPI000BE55B5F|nr:UDP-N-acetylmuramoyl-tripeptide--D-alanyl-D-alanine ligase [Mangrovitalea sediminis]
MMRTFTLTEAAAALAGELAGADAAFTRVSTDTRTLKPGDLYVALRGGNFDGHEFVTLAAEKGAVAAVVERVDNGLALPQLKVADSLVALGALACMNRRESQVRTVAVTGSSGKTTVKEMTAAILRQAGSTLATVGNFNNAVGVPLTLFGLSPEHRFAVIELGASGLGEIAATVQMAAPEVVIITNAGQAHLEGFGSYENIVSAKGEIIDGVADGGTVVLNADDPAYPQWRERAGQRQLRTVSILNDTSDYQARELISEDGESVFTVAGPGGWHCRIRLPLLGQHNVMNALMAIAACRALGVGDVDIIEGLGAVVPVKGRLQSIPVSDDVMVIDDSYNANPASMRAAMNVLAERSGFRVAVLGDMAELGPEESALHVSIGRIALELGIESLYACGHHATDYARGFGRDAVVFEDQAALIAALEKVAQRPLSILVKGSRSAGMDAVVRALTDKVNS